MTLIHKVGMMLMHKAGMMLMHKAGMTSIHKAGMTRTSACERALQVFRLCIENSIEEKVIEKAYKKLRLDALVIQQGRLTDNSQNKVHTMPLCAYTCFLHQGA